MLAVKAASPEWVDDNFPPGTLAVTNVLDGSASRNQDDRTCYHTATLEHEKPYANFSISNPMRMARVEILTRDHPGQARHPVGSLINMRVFTCSTDADCNECPMEDKDSLSDNTHWVHYLCNYNLTHLLVLTHDPSYYLMACEVQAFGYP